ncbi:DUF2255 family protein [Amycolatopsis sp. NEAU-NG30]|uniref:DUF2255 family protein n=1 Tax=Amycolatopsis melonis TaxID=3156488 RepID=A0ABV0LPL8_9PSEU
MTGWSAEQLDHLGSTGELEITTARDDGSSRAWVPIWVVRVGDELFVRSYRGTQGGWYRHATRLARGRIRAGGVEHAVGFVPAETSAAVDDAYRAKYGRYAGGPLDPMLSERAAATTLKLVPQN